MISDSVHNNSNSFIWNERKQQCRICLQPMSEQSVNVICQCRGDLACIHERCHLEWVNRVGYKTDKFAKSYILCDVCKSPLSVEVTTTYQCYGKDEMVRRMGQQILELILLGVFGIFLLVGVGVQIYYIFVDEFFMIIFSLITLITMVLEFTVLYIFIVKFLVNRLSRVTKILSYRSKNNKVYNSNITEDTII